MPKLQNSQTGEPHQMVEQSLFDIYLCDNCEAELYSLEAYQVSVFAKNGIHSCFFEVERKLMCIFY